MAQNKISELCKETTMVRLNLLDRVYAEDSGDTIVPVTVDEIRMMLMVLDDIGSLLMNAEACAIGM